MKQTNHKGHEAGFSLIEVLLSISIGALIILGAVRISQDWAERVRHREEASYLIAVNEAAKSYVATNFGAIVQDGFLETITDISEADNSMLANVGRSLSIPIENNGGGFHLKDGTIGLPANFSDTTPLGRTVTVYVRNLGFIGDQLTLQVITTTGVDDASTARPLTRLAATDIARSIGVEAGIFSTGAGCDGAISSVYGNWNLPGSTLNSASALMSGTSAYCPPANVTRGVSDYVVLQDRVTYASMVSGDYLYRVPIAGMPSANRMDTNLDMNQFNIDDVASITVDNMVVQGNVYVTGTGGAALYVDEALRVSGSGSHIRGTRTNTSVSGGSVRMNNLTAAGLNTDPDNGADWGRDHISLNAARMEVDEGMTIGGNLAVGGLLDTNDGTLSTPEMVTGNAVILTGGTISTGTLQVAQPSTVTTLNTGQATIGLLEADAALNATNVELITDMGFGGRAVIGGLSAQEVQMRQLDNCTATVVYDWETRQHVQTDAYDCKVGPTR